MVVASPPADNKSDKSREHVARIGHEYLSSKSIRGMNCRPETMQNNLGEEAAVVAEVERKDGSRRPLLLAHL
jgi:hypothetical protein